MVTQTVDTSSLPLPVLSHGKVRDMYLVDDQLLMVASDRISAFDFVLPTPIPKKGICLTQLSRFWFDFTKSIVPNHMVATEFSHFPDMLQPFQKQLQYRSMLVKKTKVIPIECIVRGYISGSAWSSYTKDGTVCGLHLPKGLQESDKFDEPLFTPSTKAASGHDINISFEEMVKLVGKNIADQLRDYSMELYESATAYALKKGIIIADTKFEFGLLNDEVMFIDEAFTPDSSRFWPADLYTPGKSQPSFDKQFVRDYLTSTGWDKNSNPPPLPEHVVQETQKKYQESYEKITGKKFSF